MLSERYRPKIWADFVAQPITTDIESACNDQWIFFSSVLNEPTHPMTYSRQTTGSS